jgi:hypothetical protein
MGHPLPSPLPSDRPHPPSGSYALLLAPDPTPLADFDSPSGAGRVITHVRDACPLRPECAARPREDRANPRSDVCGRRGRAALPRSGVWVERRRRQGGYGGKSDGASQGGEGGCWGSDPIVCHSGEWRASQRASGIVDRRTSDLSLLSKALDITTDHLSRGEA